MSSYYPVYTSSSGGIRSSVVERLTAGQQVKRSILNKGMIHNKIHLISPGCPQPRIALQYLQNHGLKHQSLHILQHLFLLFQPTADGRYQCSLCPLTFASQVSQRRHEKHQHFRKYPYHCPECGKGMAEKADLNAHLASVHGQEQLKVLCPHCGKAFTRKNNMMAHIREAHRNFV